MSQEIVKTKSRNLNMGRDSSWLISADIVAVFLALIGQVVLTRTLITEDYGIFIIALDIFATIFLIVDLGLPTILARDGAKNPSLIWPAILRIYKIQAVFLLPFLLLSLLMSGAFIDDWSGHWMTLLVCMLIAIAHIFSYAPRSGLRTAGLAWLEAWTKIIERFITMSGYLILYFIGSNSVEHYAIAFLIGALVGLFAALLFAMLNLKTSQTDVDWSTLDDCWADQKSLILQALPFAITLGVLPYVVRIEKFIVALGLGIESAALLHVAQIAWLAGLVVPQAMRAALLPILGGKRYRKQEFNDSITKSFDLCFALIPVGLYGGALLIEMLLPLAFPSQYTNGELGASAVDLFIVLLSGWCLTVLATPTYTALQAGKNPWNFTIFIASVVLFATILGIMLIGYYSNSKTNGLFAAAVASTISSAFLLFASVHLSNQWSHISERKWQFLITIVLIATTCYGFIENSLLALSGIVLFKFIPQGWQSMKTID